MYIAYSDKLMNLAEEHAREIAEQWYKTITTNPRTRSYRKVSKYKLANQAEDFYKHGKTLYFAQSAYDAATAYFTRFAENQIYENIPLDEAVYAVIMLRRQMWLFAEFQALFTTALDQYQATDSINRALLLTDYGIMAVIKKYAELAQPRERVSSTSISN
jgi:uncharacterized protein (DUF927 family)